MNWYFALSEASINRQHHDWRDMIMVAVHSAKTCTQLTPHLIYDGEESAFTQRLRDYGVRVIRHRSTFFRALEAHAAGNADYVAIASGAFLRFDIPLIDDTEFCLYTDCDVIFQSHPDFGNAARPALFAATSQTSPNPALDLNSGVMLMNVNAMRAEHGSLVDFTVKNLAVGLDQEILRTFWNDRYQPMDRGLNWKPYWGVNDAAAIIHFHGPKPNPARIMANEVGPSAFPYWEDLYHRNIGGYAYYVAAWDKVLRSID